VVAEGVETKVQADVLSAMGIESLQGFYFSKPIKVDELAPWHKAFKHKALTSETNTVEL
jgi:EAL domain-containing protein (putative c-di-GMP-specific phosphodiesterase class I)